MAGRRQDMWIVELQPGCWICDGDGDPPRTLKITNAQHYETEQYAIDALKWARSFRPFPAAKIERVVAE
jgi:hypothetical protein